MYQQTRPNLDNDSLQNGRFDQVQFYIDQARQDRAGYLGGQLRRLLKELDRQLDLMILARQWMSQGHQRLARGTDYRSSSIAG